MFEKHDRIFRWCLTAGLVGGFLASCLWPSCATHAGVVVTALNVLWVWE